METARNAVQNDLAWPTIKNRKIFTITFTVRCYSAIVAFRSISTLVLQVGNEAGTIVMERRKPSPLVSGSIK